MRNTRKNGLILLIYVICGIVIGGFLGEFLGKFIPILKLGYSFGVSPHTYDLSIIKLTFGLSLNINMFGVLGIIIGILLHKRL